MLIILLFAIIAAILLSQLMKSKGETTDREYLEKNKSKIN